MQTTITPELVLEVHEGLWQKLVKKYKDAFSVPKDESTRATETVRGMDVLLIWQREGSTRHPLHFLRTYGVPDDIAKYIVDGFTGYSVSDESEKPEKRRDKWSAFEQFAQDHVGEQFSIDQLVEVAGFSYQTTLGYIKESLHYKKIKNGLYEATCPPERK
jgi:hypothetical protein